MKTNIRYPQGAGGAWLRSLCNRLYNENYEFSNELKINFHDEIITKSPITASVSSINSDDCVFSDSCGFNFYLNFWWKHRIYSNHDEFNSKSDHECLYVLTDEARWILYDQNYKNQYIKNTDICWKWLWEDPDQFKSSLIRLFDIKLDDNKSRFISLQIDSYKKTCVCPSYHFNNPYSLPWLAWCHAIINQLGIPLPFNLEDASQIPLLSSYVKDNHNLFVNESLPYIFILKTN